MRVMFKNFDEIKHPVVRAALSDLDAGKLGYEIHHDGDLPARSGTGSSSSFAVGKFAAAVKMPVPADQVRFTFKPVLSAAWNSETEKE